MQTMTCFFCSGKGHFRKIEKLPKPWMISNVEDMENRCPICYGRGFITDKRRKWLKGE